MTTPKKESSGSSIRSPGGTLTFHVVLIVAVQLRQPALSFLTSWQWYSRYVDVEFMRHETERIDRREKKGYA